ncbi:MAG: nitrate reductase associated protein [Oculatellaceae cyanobacterium Prado106]|jgi:hypothetical protein|nr:nitrate reductase associated protein [Oculatellaceae cyanobacterium Prado106]
MTHFFQFEADFVDSLRCIPMQVRYKLDSCGVKLKLSHWNQFTAEERQALVEADGSTPEALAQYRSLIHRFVEHQGSDRPTDLPIESSPAWMDDQTIPESVLEQAEKMAIALPLEEWASLSPLQRFALIKLSRSQHENRNFLPAVQEFIPGSGT